jgi:hypothetical protein
MAMSSCWFERWCWLVVLLLVAVFGAIGGHAIQAKPTPHANEADFSAVVRNYFEVDGTDLTYFKVDKIVDRTPRT